MKLIQLILFNKQTINENIYLVLIFTLISLIILKWNKISSFYRSVSSKTWAILLIIFITGALLRISVAPHIILRDHLHDYGEMYAAFEKNPITSYGLTPRYIFLYSIAIFGESPEVLYNTTAIIGSLSIITIFLMLYATTKNEKLALFASATLAFLPVHIKYSGSLALVIQSIFFSILTFTALFLHIRTKDKSLYFLSLIFLFLAMTTRPEMYLIGIVFFSVLVFYNRLRFPLLYFSGIFIILITAMPQILFMLEDIILSNCAIGNCFIIGTTLGGRIHLFFNHNHNTFLSPSLTPTIFILLYVLGSIYLLKKDKKLFTISIIWTAIFFFIHSSDLADPVLAESRFNLQYLVPFVIMCSYGIYWIRRISLRLKKRWIYLLVLTLIFLSPFFYLKMIRSEFNPQYEYDFMKSAAKNITPGSTIVVRRFDYSANSAKFFEIINPDFKVVLISDSKDIELDDNVYYFQGLSCYREMEDWSKMHPFCQMIREEFILEPILKKTYSNTPYDRHDTYDGEILTFGIYRIFEYPK